MKCSESIPKTCCTLRVQGGASTGDFGGSGKVFFSPSAKTKGETCDVTRETSLLLCLASEAGDVDVCSTRDRSIAGRWYCDWKSKIMQNGEWFAQRMD